ncbi:MAG: hypothetical protein ACYCWL_10585, partial [Thauera sp.]
LEVDAPLGRVELDLGDVPGRLQAKCGGEEGFDLVVHRVRGRRQCRAVVPPQIMFVEKSISTGNGIEPTFIREEPAVTRATATNNKWRRRSRQEG